MAADVRDAADPADAAAAVAAAGDHAVASSVHGACAVDAAGAADAAAGTAAVRPSAGWGTALSLVGLGSRSNLGVGHCWHGCCCVQFAQVVASEQGWSPPQACCLSLAVGKGPPRMAPKESEGCLERRQWGRSCAGRLP